MSFIFKKKKEKKKRKERDWVGYFMEKANTVNKRKSSYFCHSCKKTNKERYSSSTASISMGWD